MRLNSMPKAVKEKFLEMVNNLSLRITQSSHSSLSIVTAFDSSHYLSGVQLLESLSKFGYLSETIVYDLGLSRNQFEEIHKRFPAIQLRLFPFYEYPAYFNVEINAGEYAWKPVITASLMEGVAEHIIWLDAGDKLTGTLVNFNKLVDKYGFFAVPTSNSILDLTHEQSIRLLGVNPDLCKQLQLSAAFIGFCMKNENVRNLLNEWSSNALDRAVIAPEGSDRSNHRQDQSIFNLLVVRNEYLRKSARRINARRFKANHYRILTHQDLE